MGNVRIIPRLDIKGQNVIKAIQLEGLRVVGKPSDLALKYYECGADELICMDAVASLYGRNNLSSLINEIANNVFIPITVGGGIREVDDVWGILRSGADKVAVNTAAVKRPDLLTEISQRFGSQAIVLSIEAKQNGPQSWEAYTDNGREKTGLDVISWAREAQNLGVGEILLTSVDREGTRSGFDLELVKRVANAVTVPIIASGGMGEIDHLRMVASEGASGVAVADMLHYHRSDIGEIKRCAQVMGVPVRLQ